MADSDSDNPVDGDRLINRGKPWTDWDLEYLRGARHRGATVMELAAYLKRDANEVDAKCEFMGM